MADVLLGLGWLAGSSLAGFLLVVIPGELISIARYRRRYRELFGGDISWRQGWRDGSS